MKNKYYHLFSLSFLVFFSSIIFSCNDEPTAIGFSLIPDSIQVLPITSLDTTMLTGSEIMLVRQSIFNSGSMLLGRYQDMEAFSILNFDMPDSLTYLKASDIDSAILVLPLKRYALGDTTDPYSLSFKVYQVKKSWTTETTWDSIYGSGMLNEYIDFSKALASFNGSIEQADTMAPLVLDFDKQTIEDWFSLKADSLTYVSNWGIALVSDFNSRVIRTFVAQTIGLEDTNSRLKVYYTNKDQLKSLKVMYPGKQASFTNAAIQDPKSITIHDGINYASKIYFDVSILPPLAEIHMAQLELTLDTTRSVIGNLPIDSTLYAVLYIDSTISGSPYREYYAEIKDGTTDKYLFPDIASAITTWARYSDGKGYLVIYPEGMDNTYREIDRLVFYGFNTQDSTKHPKLRIIYSTRPKFDY